MLTLRKNTKERKIMKHFKICVNHYKMAETFKASAKKGTKRNNDGKKQYVNLEKNICLSHDKN